MIRTLPHLCGFNQRAFWAFDWCGLAGLLLLGLGESREGFRFDLAKVRCSGETPGFPLALAILCGWPTVSLSHY